MPTWADQIARDFIVVAKLAGTSISKDEFEIEVLKKPHNAPSRLPRGKMAVYVFCTDDVTLKVGKVGPKSSARYVSQHYNPGSAKSTLAASLLSDAEVVARHGLTPGNISNWIKANTHRVNFLLDCDEPMGLLSLLEAFAQCRLRPVYEGVPAQRAR